MLSNVQPREPFSEVLSVRVPSRVSAAILAEVRRTKRRPADIVRDALVRGMGLDTSTSPGHADEVKHGKQPL